MNRGGDILLSDLGVADPLVLPDWLLGRREFAHVEVFSPAAAGIGGSGSRIFEDDIILWEWGYWLGYTSSTGTYLRVGLGEGTPATEAAMLMCSPLVAGFGRVGPEPRRISCDRASTQFRCQTRSRVAAKGRVLVAWLDSGATANEYLNVWCVFSLVPDRMPVWAARYLGLSG